jgi:hypothetical protein
MAQTTPPTITPAPQPPQRNNRATFGNLLDAFLLWLFSVVAQFQALATNVYNNAVDAFSSAEKAHDDAEIAASAAQAAISAANITRWVSGTTYQQDACVISPADNSTYRRKTATGVSTVDPSADPTNWAPPVVRGTPRIMVITTTQPFIVPAAEFEVELQGAGGGGQNGGQQGGGAGGYVRKRFAGATVGATAMITLGAKGTGQPQSGGLDTSAQSSSFVLAGFTPLTAGGGSRGGANPAVGGAATGGDLNIPGAYGRPPHFQEDGNTGGAGGDSLFGRSNPNKFGEGLPSTGYGAGGASGSQVYFAPGQFTPHAGAAGGDAVCIIRY